MNENRKQFALIAENTFLLIEEKASKTSETYELSDQDLVELHAIFGPVLERALDIFEKQPTLKLYVTEDGHRSLIEIKGLADNVYRIFPKINYCPCAAFKHQVLEKRSTLTCKHILAGRIAKITVFCVLAEGLKVTVEEGKSMQAAIYIPSNNFTEYTVKDDCDVTFKINLNILTECMNIFGTAEESSLKMYYRGDGEPLILVLKPQNVDNVMTDCEIKTQIPEALLDFLEEDSTKDRSCIDIPKTSDMIESFRCDEAVKFKYQCSHVRQIMKALAVCSKVVLQCSALGLLMLQLKLERDDKNHMYAEFYIMPLLDDYD